MLVHPTRRALLCCAVVVLVALLAAARSGAATGPAKLTLSRTKAPPTVVIAVSGVGFGAGETVELSFDGSPLGAAGTDASGAFSEQVSVPADALPGLHPIRAVGTESGLSAQRTLRVRTNWAQSRFDARRSGYNPYENVLDPGNVAGLATAWRFHPGCCDVFTGSMLVVANGVVYADGFDLESPEFKAVFAVDVRTHRLLWGRVCECRGSSAAVARGVVYVRHAEGVSALNAMTGALLWTAPISASGEPTVANGVVYLGGQNVYALDATSGALLWSAQPGTDGFSSAAVAGGVVYVVGSSGRLFAFDAAGGAPLWQTSALGLGPAPAVGNGLVYVGATNSNLYAFDAATGTMRWSAATGAAISSSPALAHGMTFVGSDALYAFDATTGAKRWSTTPGAGFGTSATVANGVVYIGSNDGTLSAFREATGAPILSMSTGGCIQNSPAVRNGKVYSMWCGDLVVLALPPGATGVAAAGRRSSARPAAVASS